MSEQKLLFPEEKKLEPERKHVVGIGIDYSSRADLDYKLAVSQNPEHDIVVMVTVPAKVVLDTEQIKKDMNISCNHICMLVNIREREATGGDA